MRLNLWPLLLRGLIELERKFLILQRFQLRDIWKSLGMHVLVISQEELI